MDCDVHHSFESPEQLLPYLSKVLSEHLYDQGLTFGGGGYPNTPYRKTRNDIKDPDLKRRDFNFTLEFTQRELLTESPNVSAALRAGYFSGDTIDYARPWWQHLRITFRGTTVIATDDTSIRIQPAGESATLGSGWRRRGSPWPLAWHPSSGTASCLTAGGLSYRSHGWRGGIPCASTE